MHKKIKMLILFTLFLSTAAGSGEPGSILRPALLITGLIFLTADFLYPSFSRRVMRPLGLIFKLLKNTAGEFPLAERESLAGQAVALRRLMHDYHEQKIRIAGYEERLHRASSLVQSLRQERLEWLASASQEMDQAFEAISAYAEFLREKTHNFQNDVNDISDYDEVREAGRNLKFVANGFYLHCVRQMMAAESPKIPEALLEKELNETLRLLAPALERRDIEILYRQVTQTRLPLDPTILQHSLWGALYLAVHFAAPSARIKISVHYPSKNKALLRVEVSDYSLAQPTAKARNFGPFTARRTEKDREQLLRRLNSHVNSLIIKALFEDSQGGYSANLSQETGYRLEVWFALHPAASTTQADDESGQAEPLRVPAEIIPRILESL